MKTRRIWLLISFLTITLILGGCASKNKEGAEYGKSAEYWYQQIGDSIAKNSLDKADKYFVSLKSEHPESPLVETANTMIAHAHMEKEEYLLAGYFFDEYTKRFGGFSMAEYVEFMKIKASFLGVKKYYRDQKLIMDTITNGENYLLTYPNSQYAPLVKNMVIRLKMSQYLLNEDIASLYDRTGKEAAAKIYREKNNAYPIKMEDIAKPKEGFFDYIF
ncbi:MAG: outer membrane protein assembly factor BamD [Sulfurovaceae bacterium]|nr:outer membrane protein assembly factor BamD [Sulfurovaceae bacterium]